MYLAAAEITTDNILTEWNGTKGKFLKTFGMNNKRNKNEWRAPWSGIVENAKTAIGMPGIAYEKCVEGKCGLDHVEADTFEETVEKQKPFKVTEIKDYTLNEDKSQVDFIHEVVDDEFWEKVKSGKIKYVSPMIWPATGGYDIVGMGRDNIPQIDAFHWQFVHHAFLEENPAFGKDANISVMCEGEGCPVKLLSAKEVKEARLFGDKKDAKLFGDISTANAENLSHLQEIPLLIRHKGKLHLISASTCVSEKISHLSDSRPDMDSDQRIAVAFSECGESSKGNISFMGCSCASKHTMSLEAQLEETKKEKENLESKLQGMEDDDHKEARYKSKLAKYASIFKGMEEKDREDMIAKFRAAMSDDEHDKTDMKAMEENHEEMKSKKGAEENGDDKNKDLEATLRAMQAKEIPGMISGLIALRKATGATKPELTSYHEVLKAKSFINLHSDFVENQPAITRLSAKLQNNNVQSFEFENSDYTGSSLAAKTLNETFGDTD